MDFNKDSERRATPPKSDCSKLDTFANIASTLHRIEVKVDDLSEEMRVMIKLEQQVLNQSKDIERLNTMIEELRKQNKELSDRLLELRSNFENQKQSISMIERIGWAAGTVVAIIIGKQLGIS
jgi:predicted RNase H-like nuclease (RuvC/YqgF family)